MELLNGLTAKKALDLSNKKTAKKIYSYIFRQINTNGRGYGRVSLEEGQKVTYTVGKGDKGPQAENVTAL